MNGSLFGSTCGCHIQEVAGSLDNNPHLLIRILASTLEITKQVCSCVQEETPLDYAKTLSVKMKNDIWLKREDLQPVFSFKLRGAFNKMASLSSDKLEAGVICSSAGNHAQGVALAAKHLGTSAVICMPVNTPEIKVQSPCKPKFCPSTGDPARLTEQSCGFARMNSACQKDLVCEMQRLCHGLVIVRRDGALAWLTFT
jgi:hypothetical protein